VRPQPYPRPQSAPHTPNLSPITAQGMPYNAVSRTTDLSRRDMLGADNHRKGQPPMTHGLGPSDPVDTNLSGPDEVSLVCPVSTPVDSIRHPFVPTLFPLSCGARDSIWPDARPQLPIPAFCGPQACSVNVLTCRVADVALARHVAPCSESMSGRRTLQAIASADGRRDARAPKT
jgi:hypothetical protein